MEVASTEETLTEN